MHVVRIGFGIPIVIVLCLRGGRRVRERFGRMGNELRSRARDQARWLIRDHGDHAEAVIAAKLRRKTNSASDAYRYRCTERELKRLREIEAEEAAAAQRHTALVVWTPSAFGVGTLFTRLFRRKRGTDYGEG